MQLVRLVLGADGVVTAEAPELERGIEVARNPSPHLDQTPERAFRVRRARIEQETVGSIADVDALADASGGVTAFQGNGCQQEMRKRVEHDVRQVFVDGGLTLYADFREPWSSE